MWPPQKAALLTTAGHWALVVLSAENSVAATPCCQKSLAPSVGVPCEAELAWLLATVKPRDLLLSPTFGPAARVPAVSVHTHAHVRTHTHTWARVLTYKHTMHGYTH